MYDYLKEDNYLSGLDTKIDCDLDLAQEIYSKIIENHPNIDDETAVKYFKRALNKSSNEKKHSRTRKL